MGASSILPNHRTRPALATFTLSPSPRMSPSPESDSQDPTPNAKPDSTPRKSPPLVLSPITGPPMPDMTAKIEESRRRHEAELAKAQQLVAQARAGSAPTTPARTTEPLPPPAPGDYRVEIDWRGETAYYVEHDRRVRLECIYWGGPKGSVSHIDGVWESSGGARERLTAEERASVLQCVIDHARKRDNIKLEIAGA